MQEQTSSILLSRGYAPADAASADFVVRIERGRRLKAPDAPVNVPKEQIDGPYSGYLDDEDQDLVEGKFVIDAFDRKTGKLLCTWRVDRVGTESNAA